MSVTLRKKDLKNAGKYSLYLDIYQNQNKRKFEFLKLYLYKKPRTQEQKSENHDNLKLAESIRAKRELMLNTTDNGFNAVIRLRTNFFDFAQIICDEKEGSTARDYKTTIDHFKNFAKTDNFPIGNISRDTIDDFKKYLSTTNLKENTRFNYFAKLKTIFKEAFRKKMIHFNPCDDVKNIKVNPVQKCFLSIEEIQKLSDTPCKSDKVKRAFLFACNTGLRFCDVKKLTSNDFINNSLQFKQQKTDEVIYLPLNNSALKLIGTETKPEEKIFDIYKDIGHCNTILKDWSKNAGINKNLTFHVARHSFATNLLIYGTDISVVSKLLGHTTLKHTMIYAKIVNSLKNNAVNNLPEINF